jgi:hypothetical protein
MGLLTTAEFFSGIGVMVLDVGLGSVQAAVIPDQLRSRVWGAILLVNWGIRPIGALTGGLMAGAIGLRPTMWIAAAGGIAGVLWLLPSGMSQVRDVSARGGLSIGEDGLPAGVPEATEGNPERAAATAGAER